MSGFDTKKGAGDIYFDFLRYGEILNVHMLRSLRDDSSKQAAYITFMEADNAQALLNTWCGSSNTLVLDGRELFVRAAEPHDFDEWVAVQDQAAFPPVSSANWNKSGVIAIAVKDSNTKDCTLDFRTGDRMTRVVCRDQLVADQY